MTENYNTTKFKIWRKRWKAAIVYASGNCCQICQYNKCIEAMEFHHIDPTQKDFALGTIKQSPSMNEKIIDELIKCVLLCSNCHKEVHAGHTIIPSDYVVFDVSKYFSYLEDHNASKRKYNLRMEKYEEAKINTKSFSACCRYLKTDSRSLRRWFIANNMEYVKPPKLEALL